ncbi:MAG: serine/threonine-protein kinase [Polyangiaceae bacterium]
MLASRIVRISLERFHPVRRSLRRRALWLIGLGVPGVVFSSFWVLLAALMFVWGEQANPWEDRAVATILFVFGLLPLSVTGFMLWRGIANWSRAGQYERLIAIAEQNPGASLVSAARMLGLPGKRVTSLALQGATYGFITDMDQAELWLVGHEAPDSDEDLSVPGEDSSGIGPRKHVLGNEVLAQYNAQLQQTDPGGSMVGALLGGTYRMEALIGAGAMGDVYSATHLRTGRRYAVKTIRRDLPVSEEAQRRFEREALAVNRIGHPGIVAVHDFDRAADGTLFMVMDHLEGETLEARLQRVGKLSWDETRRFALDLASALAAAHAQRLVHRDLKPANVFVRREAEGTERAVILDFGLAKPVDDAVTSRITATGAAVGTPMYMSPEQARGEVVDQRSDIYGLCAVIYEMATGAPPFMDQTLASVYARLLTEPAAPASALLGSDCPAGLDEVLARGLAKQPGERYSSVHELATALGNVGAGDQALRTA